MDNYSHYYYFLSLNRGHQPLSTAKATLRSLLWGKGDTEGCYGSNPHAGDFQSECLLDDVGSSPTLDWQCYQHKDWA